MAPEAISLLGRAAALARQWGIQDAARVARDATDAVLWRLGVLPLRAEVDGLDLRGFLRHRSFLTACGGEYERFTRELFLRALRSRTVVVDAGAHIGLYTLLAARYVREGVVLAFEPDPFNASALARNVARHRFAAVTIIPMALTDREEITTFYSSKATLGGSLIPRRDIGPRLPIRVPGTTLDRQLERRDVDELVIKLDVEGGEPSALRGMRSVLGRVGRATLFVEMHPQALEQGGSSPRELLDLLAAQGFRARFIQEDERRLLPIMDDTFARKGNLYCVRDA